MLKWLPWFHHKIKWSAVFGCLLSSIFFSGFFSGCSKSPVDSDSVDRSKDITFRYPIARGYNRSPLKAPDESKDSLKVGQPNPIPKELTSSLKTALEKRDFFEAVNRVDDILKLLSIKPFREGMWGTQALNRMLDNREGLINTEPDQPFQHIGFKTGATEDGRRIRTSFNKLSVSKTIYEKEYQLYCQHHSQQECDAQRPVLDQMELTFQELSFAHLFADALSVSELSAFKPLMQALEDITTFYFNAAKGAFDAALKIGDGFPELVLHPIDYTKNLSLALADAFLNSEAIVEVITQVLKDKTNTFLHGSPEESGRIFGEVFTEVMAFFYGPAEVVAWVAKIKRLKIVPSATQRATLILSIRILLKENVPLAKSEKALSVLQGIYADIPKEQVTELINYSKGKQFKAEEVIHLFKFRHGVSIFVSKEVYEMNIKNKLYITDFVIPTDRADELLNKVQSTEELAKALGREPDSFENGVVRLDLPLRFSDKPQLSKSARGILEITLEKASTENMIVTELTKLAPQK